MRLLPRVKLIRTFGQVQVAVKPEILRILDPLDDLHIAHTGREAVITSCLDGIHSPHSRHYSGLAIDVRIWHLDRPVEFVHELKALLGVHYDVVLEADHIHIEFDPER